MSALWYVQKGKMIRAIRYALEINKLDLATDIAVDYTEKLRELGIFNYIYCDGEFLFAHSHKRTQADGDSERMNKLELVLTFSFLLNSLVDCSKQHEIVVLLYLIQLY